MQKTFHVYILTNKKDGVLYIGVTSDLVQRIHQHKTNAVEGFTSNYNLHHLVYFEEHATAEAAIREEVKELASFLESGVD